MKKLIALLLSLALLLVFVAACAPEQEAPAPAPEAPAPEPPADPSPPDDAGDAPALEAPDVDADDRTRPDSPITIGLPLVMTGTFAMFGEYALNGITLALEWEDRVDDFNLVLEDSQGNAEVVLTMLDLLNHRDGARIMIGPCLGGEGLASAQWAHDHPDVLLMPVYSAPQDITMRLFSENIARAGFTGEQTTFDFGRFVAQEMGYRNIVIVGADYAFPWSQSSGFIRGFLENGGERVERVWYPMGNLDFAGVMANLIELSGDYEAVLINDGGASVLAFLSAWEMFGLDAFYDRLFGATNITFPFVLAEMPESFEGLVSATHYWHANPTPVNQQFVEMFRERFGTHPSPVAVQGFDTMRVVIRALEALDWNYDDTEALVREITSLTVTDSPRGSFYFCDWHHAVQDVYLVETYMGADGIMTTRLITTFQNVNQFGPYVGMEEQYLATPIHDREYPPGQRDAYFEELAVWFGQEHVDALIARGGW